MHRRLVLGKNIVGVAVEPAFARLSRCDDRMVHGTRVFGCVLIRGAVAASRTTALLACAQVDPATSNFDAFLTLVPLRVFRVLDRLDVVACLVLHLVSQSRPLEGISIPLSEVCGGVVCGF